jgi:hypothetical protein
MDPKYIVNDLKGALAQQLFPTVTVWNRLEGRPRRSDFDRALKAEVRDPLWMLTKQFQIGEFKADDAGSPVLTKLRMRSAPLTRYQPGDGSTEPLDPNMPLETKVEQRILRWEWNRQKMHLDLRAQLGRQWRRMLLDAGLQEYQPQYLALYPIALPASDETTDYVYAHRQAWQQYAALAGRSIDGGDLHLHLSNAGNRASDGIAVTVPGDGASLDSLGEEFERWFAALYHQPATEDAWKPSYLEYQFGCSAPRGGQERVMAAEEYAQGRLDWYSFDFVPEALGGGSDPGEKVEVSSFLPTSVTFQGMPDPRWWALEDRKTDFGSVKPSTTDLAQLLLMEFALVYADDWFVLPFRVPSGSLARIDGMAVTNTFGERLWITPAGTGSEQDWHRWAMFQINSTNPAQASSDPSLFLPPAAIRILEGASLEEVELARDEVANMVWAIERTVPSVTGVGRSGRDEAREILQYHARLAANAVAPVFQAGIAYQAMTSVPEHFIPFVPVHVPGSLREIQLQRSRMLRIIEGDALPPEKVPPRTTLMRQGLDETPKQPYFLHEEEVPRAGIVVTQSFRRTRWKGGETYVWLAVQKQSGRGERSSGLAFDAIVNAQA